MIDTASSRPSPSLRIFISYRREDAAGHAGRLYDALVAHFGENQVFMDIDTIRPGSDFSEALNTALDECDVLLALIGRTWLTRTDQNARRRLDNPHDFVRREVEAALRRHIVIIPLLVQGADMPILEQLPHSLGRLATRQAVELSDRRWRSDIHALIDELDRLQRDRPAQSQQHPPTDEVVAEPGRPTPSPPHSSPGHDLIKIGNAPKPQTGTVPIPSHHPNPPLGDAAYLHEVADVAPARLEGRDEELAQLAALVREGPSYTWWEAPPWAGKTALTSWFALHHPADIDVVAYFVGAGRGASSAFLEAVAEQLTVVTGRPLGGPETTEVRRAGLLALLREAAARAQAAARGLLVLVDGLDEDEGVSPSIAALLPRNPPDGLRVLVTSRPGHELPHDVPDDHPLRRCPRATVAASPVAGDVAERGRRELAAVLADPNTSPDVVELVGFVTAAGGGLDEHDLAVLTGSTAAAVAGRLRGATARSVTSRVRRLPGSAGPEGVHRGYVFAHRSLRESADAAFGPALSEYRARLLSWAQDWAALGWPADTPVYLLRDHPQALAASGATAALAALAVDERRHDLMLDLTGGDALALDEIALAFDRQIGGGQPDLTACAVLAAHREDLLGRARHVPSEIPGVLAAAGRLGRAEGMARGQAHRGGAALADVAAAAAWTRPRVAEALLADLPRPAQRDTVLARLAEAAATVDLDVAETYLARMGPGGRDAALERVAALVAADRAGDVAGVVERAAVDPKGPRALAALAVAATASGDTSRSRELVARLPRARRDHVRALLAMRLVRDGDLIAALEFADAVTAPAERAPVLADLVAAAHQDAECDTTLVARADAALQTAIDSLGRTDRAVDLLLTTAARLRTSTPTQVIDLERAAELERAAAELVEAVPDPRHRDQARLALVAAHLAARRTGEAHTLAGRTAARDGGALAAAVATVAHALDGTGHGSLPEIQSALRVVAGGRTTRSGLDRPHAVIASASQIHTAAYTSQARVRAATALAGALVRRGDVVGALCAAMQVERWAQTQDRRDGRGGVVVERTAEALAALGEIDEALALALTLDRASELDQTTDPAARGERESRPLPVRRAASVADSAVTRVVETAVARGDLDAAILAAAAIGNATQHAWALVAVVVARTRTGDHKMARQLAHELRPALDAADPATRAVAFARLIAALGPDDGTDESAEGRLHTAAAAAAATLEATGDLPGLTRVLTYLRAAGATTRDPLAMLDTAPDAHARDRAAVQLVDALIDLGQTDDAAHVAATVSAPASRARAFAAVAAHHPDPRAARTALNQAMAAAKQQPPRGENTSDDHASVDRERTLAQVAAAAAAIDDGPATRMLVAEVLATGAWPEVLPALARIEPAAVRTVADRLRETAESERKPSSSGEGSHCGERHNG